ncbi:glycosyl hydrolase family 65 protein [Roseibacterium sp. SDUM158017]|uniref:glycoside hydrolase family 65 protein n=1 Tax=Roseicyclus salinarum TaxID=3036773 RepID=UPI0024150B5B|nr:glycosyl hydrolase family 65 protein [Roseibacterium sp. SDUM158017]MDG4647830.1 glycosyl hydrolase family 65 protein [Roseibacterium sp. SDUM158017]
MSDVWCTRFSGYDPRTEGRRETLCALGNGYIVTRAAAADAVADDVHYPGTYLAGGYDRLVSEVGGQSIENEDLVNLPNWLPLAMRIGDGPWLRPDAVQYLDYRQDLDLMGCVLTRSLRFRDEDGRVTRWDERRIASMRDPHLCALAVTITPENWSGAMHVRAGLDGSVTNWGVARYRDLDGRHLETLDTSREDGGILALRSRFVQARREVALAARTTVTVDGGHISAARSEILPDLVQEEFDLDAQEGRAIRVEKIAAYFDSRDTAMTEPLSEALDHVRHAHDFRALCEEHVLAWKHLWEQFDIRLEDADSGAQLKLRLHIMHLLQTASAHSVEMDVGIPPRGWHGEAYRGHIMWDELFIFPFLTLRMPVLTRALLQYRFRRLDEARRAAREAGVKGAMFPWQSGSNGREESQRIHLNPRSGRWVPDNTWRQRHVGAAVAFNVWEYVQATDDRAFLRDYGAELFCEIARFFASLAEERPDGRFGIRGVMGPDEFHTAYPGVDARTSGGLDNNAYTNFMTAFILSRAEDILELIPLDERRWLCERLGLGRDELARWEEVSRRLFLPFHDDGILSQFEGYEALLDFDWDGYRARYGDLQRLDRILEAEGKEPNDYKVSKQADVLMIFYLFSAEEIGHIFARLGYEFTPDMILRNIQYYMQRTSHGSTLSWVAHAWVLARADRQRSWELARKALDADSADIQGGTTKEGIHLGAMAGTVDLMQRCYTGIEFRTGTLVFNPRLPEEVERLRSTVRFRRQILDFEITQDRLTVTSRPMTAHPVTISYRGQSRDMSPGQSFTFRLIPEIKPDREDRERAQKRMGAGKDDERRA